MKLLLKNILRRISKKQSSKEDNATAFYPDCYSRTSESVRRRIEMSYDNDVRDTISSLRILAGEMASDFVEFKKFKARRYRYDPHADSTLYASKLFHLLLNPDGSSDKKS